MTMTSDDFASFGALLKTFRKRAHLTQQEVAQAIGVHRRTVIRWEQGDVLPESKALVLELARHLKLDTQQTRHLLEASLTAPMPHWSVPFARNPYFTGREQVLSALHTQLGVEPAVALTQSAALHGLGGVGKTQIALEYAYRHALDYRAVFWIGAETEQQVISSLLRVAETLQLPGREDKDQRRVVAAVQHWLSTHGQWLLIWDNVEDLNLLHRFLSATREGALLLTTRRQALGTLARGIELVPMEHEEGMLFLLRRAKLLGLDAQSQPMYQLAGQKLQPYAAAAELVTLLGGLPLALDQAGAYLEATHCGLPAYLDLFCTRRASLLQHRGVHACDHPDSVSTTFTLTASALAGQHAAVLDLLQACALLQLDTIPEELFRQGGEHLGSALAPVCGDPLEWDRLLGVACSYSLLSRHPEEQTLSMHRLVQAVLLDDMTEAQQEHWTRRAMRALDAVFPEVQPTTAYVVLKQCERLVSHALLCLQRLESPKETLACASLSYKVAQYQYGHGQYREAEPLYRRALQLQEHALGSIHPAVASTLTGLANLSWRQGKYAEAEPLYRRALQLQEHALGSIHPAVASTLNYLANLSSDQGKYGEAEALYQRALRIREQVLGPEHSDIAFSLNYLAVLCWNQGKYAKAEALADRALRIWEQTLGPDDPKVALALGNLANLSRDQGKYAKAEVLYQRALRIWEQALGPDHPSVAMALNGQAILFLKQGNYVQAEIRLQRALSIREQHLGPGHPETAHTLHDLAHLKQKQGNLIEARDLAERTLHIRAQALGESHPKTIATRMLYTQLVQEQKNDAGPTLEHLRTLLKARGWSVHLKKRRGKLYVYATRRVGTHTHSRYLAPLSNLAACLAAVWMLPNVRED